MSNSDNQSDAYVPNPHFVADALRGAGAATVIYLVLIYLQCMPSVFNVVRVITLLGGAAWLVSLRREKKLSKKPLPKGVTANMLTAPWRFRIGNHLTGALVARLIFAFVK